jgi:hypothetical protein
MNHQSNTNQGFEYNKLTTQNMNFNTRTIPEPQNRQKAPSTEPVEEFIEFFDDENKKEEPPTDPTKKFNPNLKSDNYFMDEEKTFAPWMSEKTMSIKNPNVRLHNEIIEFTNYISPSNQDHDKRMNAIKH